MCGRFLRWVPRAIPNLVASRLAVSELYWGEKCLYVCMKIANLAPQLGRSTPSTVRRDAAAEPLLAPDDPRDEPAAQCPDPNTLAIGILYIFSCPGEPQTT